MRQITSPVLRYPGSKWIIGKWICGFIEQIEHYHYFESHCGGLNVLLQKRPSKLETVNDIDQGVINLFRVIREHPEELADLVYWTPHSRWEYESILPGSIGQDDDDYFVWTGDPVEDARRCLVRCWFGFGAKTSDRSSWAHNVQKQKHGGALSIPRRWNRLPEIIIAAAERLKMVQFECTDALELISRYRYPEVLIYADPPYPLNTRSRRLYKNELDESDHIKLLKLLREHPGPVLLSSYENDLYAGELSGWHYETKEARTELGKTRTEVLWLNPVAAKQIRADRQGELFEDFDELEG
jgi:DNA adenine methylase